MNYLELEKAIIKEIDDCLSKTDEKQIEDAVKLITESKRIFVAGAGRTGLVASEFAMRLMHIGFDVFRVGEVTTPAILEGDLLIVCSGSGETKSILNLVNVATNVNAKILLFTTKENSTISEKANNIVVIHGKATKNTDNSVKSIQPLSNLFAQSLILTMDIIIIRLMEINNIDESKLKNNHTNLE